MSGFKKLFSQIGNILKMDIKWPRIKNVAPKLFEYHFYIILNGITPKKLEKSIHD